MEKAEEEKIKASAFNPDNLIKYLEEVNASLGDIPHESWNNVMLEFVKIFNLMGSAMSIAFSDITSKVGIIRRNQNTWTEIGFKGGIISVIKHEIGLRIHILNGENPKKAPDPKYKNYESTARTILRLTWFLDFTFRMLSYLNENRKISSSEAAKTAYNEALGPHHPFVVRTAASVAMLAAPGREKFLNSLFGPAKSEEKRYEYLRIICGLIYPIRGFLWKYYQDNDLTKLPQCKQKVVEYL